MTKLASAFAGLAALAIASAPMLASAAESHNGRVAVTRADLHTPGGTPQFHAKVAAAAQDLCQSKFSHPTAHASRAACVKAIHAEASDKLAAAQASARTELASR
jgi:UrcA family protein